MSALVRLTTTETKLFFRESPVVIATLAIAPILLVILGVIPAMREPDPALGGMRLIDQYVPIVIVLGLGLFALRVLPQLFAAYRERGVLRRMRATPVKPGTMIGAQLLMATILSLATVLVVLAIGQLAFDVVLPVRPLGYLTSYLLAAVAMFAIGLLIGALAPTGRSAGAIGTLVFFPLMFFAGLWVPRAAMNDVLRTISDFTPLGAAVQSLQQATAGNWPQPLYLAVMLGWTIVAGGLAARYFRWD